MMRKLIDMAIAAGRKRQSSQTGLIHHLYHAQDDEPHRTIPIFENLLFALALFRSRTVENIEEAKVLVDRLLHFQSPESNFPVYLHEYPTCRDRYLGVQLLLPIYLILVSFHAILGSALKKRLEESARKLLHYYLSQEAPLPGFHAIKLAAVAQSFGKLWKEDTFTAWGEQLLDRLKDEMTQYLERAPAQMAELLPSLQLMHLCPKNNWDRHLLAYVGPAWCEWQEGSEPQVTLYDLYMGLLSDAFSARALKDHVVHLQGALLQPTEEKINPTPVNPFSYATIAHDEEWPRTTDRCFHRFRATWGSPEQLHTLTCQGGNIIQTVFNETTMLCTLGAPPPDGEREKCREVAFYMNVEATNQILVGTTPATTFRLGEPVIIQSGPVTITLIFNLIEGTGDFLGHIMRGNRPAQIALKGSNRFQAYDWQIFLRTLRRSETCCIQTQIKMEANDVASP